MDFQIDVKAEENGYTNGGISNSSSDYSSVENVAPSDRNPRSRLNSVEDLFSKSLTQTGPCLRSRSFQPSIDKMYNILQKDATTALGEVLAERQNSRTKTMEYFVHYEGQNRRLDEWITLDRFQGETVAPAATAPAKLKNEGKSLIPVNPAVDPLAKSTQKVTRSARRKFDEMNHIQPSLAELLPSQVSFLSLAVLPFIWSSLLTVHDR